MVIKIAFDEKKLMTDCQEYIIKHIPEIGKDGFFDSVMKVAIDSIKSTIKISTEKNDFNVFKDG